MIKKVSNWVFGSFFRTMGRFFFFLFFGFLLATILSKSNIKITDLLGIETIKASTYTTEVTQQSSTAFSITNTQDFTCQADFCDYEIQASDTNAVTSKAIGITGYDTTQYDVVAFNFVISNPISTGGIESTLYPICTEWQQSGSNYYCSNIVNTAGGTGVVQNHDLNNLSILVRVVYTDSSQSYCSLENNKIYCPTFKKQIGMIEIVSNQKSRWISYILVRVYRIAENYLYSTTQQAIENQTQTIIQNQENQTQQQIESQKVCQYIDEKNIIENNKMFNSNGTILDANGVGITDYIKITGSTIKVIKKYENQYVYTCFYDINKTIISCISNNSMTENEYLTIPNNGVYMRASIYSAYNPRPTFYKCTNGNQALQNSIDNTDTSEADSQANSFFSNFTSQDNGGISSIITAPLSAISGLVNSTCVQLELPIPYLDNKTLILPCMSAIYTEHFGQLFTLYQTIIFGAIAYRMLVSIFMMIQGFKNPDDDKIEVVDL